MDCYVSLDGGGSKLQGVLFDGDYRILSVVAAGGINPNVYDEKTITENVGLCFDTLLDDAGRNITQIKKVYMSMGIDRRFFEAVKIPILEYCVCGESVFGVLTCGVTDGICVLSGTGSFAAYVEDLRARDYIGGWGGYIKDCGSGNAIGREVLARLLTRCDKLREPSLLDEIVRERHGLYTWSEIIGAVYSKKHPIQYISSFCREAVEAAQGGDTEAQQILYNAGAELGELALKSAVKNNVSEAIPFCTSGGVFHNSQYTRQGFEDAVLRARPAQRILHPIFTPVVGGMLFCMIEHGGLDVSRIEEDCKAFNLI